MNLKNYTSDISPFKSIGNIESMLVAAGATDIAKKYEGSTCSAITFRIMVDNNGIKQPLFFQLPAKVEAVFKIFWAKRTKRGEINRKVVTEQAEKTAWKIVHDWVEIQLSMIKLNQADVIEIFLPYVYNPNTNQTFYNQLKDGGFKQLTNGQ